MFAVQAAEYQLFLTLTFIYNQSSSDRCENENKDDRTDDHSRGGAFWF